MRDLTTQLRELFESSPLTAVSLLAGAVALATTPLAFAWMARMQWFNARRGRTLQRPSWWSFACATMLAMGVPAIFLALLAKSPFFDRNRYEYDPNRVPSVVDQGRQYEARSLIESAYRLDEAVRAEQKRLAEERKGLVEGVKKLDAAMLALRESARRNPAVIPPMNGVLQSLGGIHRAVGLDAPQQLEDLKADPVALASAPPAGAGAAAPQPAAPAPAAPGVLSKPEAEAILATVPEPQKGIAGMLPLAEIPDGFVLAKIPGKEPPTYVETFDAENLWVKIDGRAESFVQYAVKGMACCSYHPAGNVEDEVQLFVFEMGDPLKARGKFDSEKPEEAQPFDLGAGAYSAAGSVFFHADRYYTIVNVAREDVKLSAFARKLAEVVAAQQKGAKGSGPSPEDVFALLPPEPKRDAPKYVAKDVFGFGFLSDVFMADYTQGESTFQGFLRPCADAAEARKIFDQYVEAAKKDGAEVKDLSDPNAEKMITASNIEMFDVVFLKGNAVAGANGATEAKAAEEFARSMAKSLPASVPVIAADPKSSAAQGAGDADN